MGNIIKPFKQQQPFAYQPLTVPLISEAQNENMRVFSFSEWMKAMEKFRQDRVEICEKHCLRAFYKGYIDDTTFAPSRTKTGTPVSVIECLHSSSQALQKWMEEVKSLEKYSHPNLVKILGYCCEDNESVLVNTKKSSLLVLEYLHKGRLDHHIFGKEKALPWEIRVKIAIGTAQGIAFLHSIKNSPLHLELRPHNIMLDEQYNAKLFYLESNNQRLKDEVFVGRFEYIPRECIMSGYVVMESDVYIFGVILLELLAGSVDRLTNWTNHSAGARTGSFLSENYKIGEIIDPRLGTDYPMKAATLMGILIQSCTKRNKNKRPLMQQVLDVLNIIAATKY
ncbi:PREDICTED: LOW QUALITY PROTEIN: putative inactive serine/threonine-protein kinase At5g11400 [Camelina sativa]|uniref:LOW QUALITY PROTEIN: putative inactive serine/threonine-protein kinase At5g11400 n=1 Tax=Camelina sativa TaxID=90675 RepID=A0ABM1RG57_CAMSA|nr:PREDICTED: LOW QUALITY PROTEIN: putative inactive serine/threonine-protein kinase At5g11400 [Camelina sativa]